jgi:tetratricopeptide (TPR) repeat protein
MRYLITLLLLLPLTIFSQADSSDYYFNQGLFKLFQKQYKEAIPYFEDAVRTNIKNKQALNNLGLCHMNLDEHKKAIKNYNKALDIDAKFIQARYNKAYCLYNLGDFDVALPEFDRVIKETINFAKAFFYRGMCKISLNQFDSSCQDIHKASSLDFAKAKMAEEIFCKSSDNP